MSAACRAQPGWDGHLWKRSGETFSCVNCGVEAGVPSDARAREAWDAIPTVRNTLILRMLRERCADLRTVAGDDHGRMAEVQVTLQFARNKEMADFQEALLGLIDEKEMPF